MELDPALLEDVRTMIERCAGRPDLAVPATEELIAKWPWNSYQVALALAVISAQATQVMTPEAKRL